MELNVICNKTATGWSVEVPELDGYTTTAKRLDKVDGQIREIAKARNLGTDCELIIKVDAKLPGIICDLEQAQEKMKLASKLQEEASAEIRDAVHRMRGEGLTLRDIAVVLGVTPQRVAQLVPCSTDV